MAAGFQTYQTVKNYDDALGRHGQWIRWLQGSICACVQQYTNQPDPQCQHCRGRGFIYRNPKNLYVYEEILKHGGLGTFYPKNTPVVNITSVTHQGIALTLSTQPADGDYIQTEPPYLSKYQRVRGNYTFSPLVDVAAEDSEVVDTNIIQTIASRFTEKGKTFEGSIESVNAVYNVTKDETYTVSSFKKEFIYLDDMGTWESGDVLEVDYVYVKPFYFVLHGVSPKMRYERSYLLEDSDGVLITPSWALLSPDDLFISLAQEVPGRCIINPNARSGNDILNQYFDVSRVLDLTDIDQRKYTEGTEFTIENRNEIKWIAQKPTKRYAVEVLYHPAYKGLGVMGTVRNAENKVFVHRLNLKLFQGASEGYTL